MTDQAAPPQSNGSTADLALTAQACLEIAGDLRRHALRIEHLAARLSQETAGDGGILAAALAEMGRRQDRSKIFELDRPLLMELCRRLLDPALTTRQTLAWLRQNTDRFLGNNAVYRFRRKLVGCIEQLSNPPQSANADPARRDLIARALASIGRRRNQLLMLPEPLLIEALERGLAQPFNGGPGCAWPRTQTALAVNNRSWFALWQQFLRRYRDLEREAAQQAHDDADQAET